MVFAELDQEERLEPVGRRYFGDAAVDLEFQVAHAAPQHRRKGRA